MAKINKHRYDNDYLSKLLRRSIGEDTVIKVFEWYESISNSYDDLYVSEQRIKYNNLMKLINIGVGVNVVRDLRILDVGCGTLELLNYLLEVSKILKANLVYYVGMDISYSLLVLGRNKIRNNVIYDIIACDLKYPPLRPYTNFNIVAFFSVLLCEYNISNILKYFISTYLASNGFLIFTVICRDRSKLINMSKHLKNELNLSECRIIRHNEILCWGVLGHGKSEESLNIIRRSCNN